MTSWQALCTISFEQHSQVNS